MNPPALYPTCVLKVNLGCCKACVVNLNKLLWKIDGVHAVDVDAEKGLVTVSGKVDPATLIKHIAKKKKKAELLSYEEPIKNKDSNSKKNTPTLKQHKTNDHQKSKTKNKSKDKDCFCVDESDDHEFEDYVSPKEYEDVECRDRHCRLHHKKPIIHHVPPMIKLQPPLHRPPPPPPHFSRPPDPHWQRHHYGEDLMEGRWRRVQNVEPVLYDRPIQLSQYDLRRGCPRPSPPPAAVAPQYGYYGSRHIPATNDCTQFLSDENAMGCSIM
ncbi:hypothetical protein CsSME_00041946 [Camellia sinensis var. sinensis]